MFHPFSSSFSQTVAYMLVDELLDVDVGLGATRKSGILNYHHIPAGQCFVQDGARCFALCTTPRGENSQVKKSFLLLYKKKENNNKK